MSTKPDPVSEVMALADVLCEAAIRHANGSGSIVARNKSEARAHLEARMQWELAALEAKVRELEKDAARWRWLNDPDNEWEPLDSAWLSKHDLYGQNTEDLDAFADAAIDSARSQNPQNPSDDPTPTRRDVP